MNFSSSWLGLDIKNHACIVIAERFLKDWRYHETIEEIIHTQSLLGYLIAKNSAVCDCTSGQKRKVSVNLYGYLPYIFIFLFLVFFIFLFVYITSIMSSNLVYHAHHHLNQSCKANNLLRFFTSSRFEQGLLVRRIEPTSDAHNVLKKVCWPIFSVQDHFVPAVAPRLVSWLFVHLLIYTRKFLAFSVCELLLLIFFHIRGKIFS